MERREHRAVVRDVDVVHLHSFVGAEGPKTVCETDLHNDVPSTLCAWFVCEGVPRNPSVHKRCSTNCACDFRSVEFSPLRLSLQALCSGWDNEGLGTENCWGVYEDNGNYFLS